MGWISGPTAGSMLILDGSNKAKMRLSERRMLPSFFGRRTACGRRKLAIQKCSGVMVSLFGAG